MKSEIKYIELKAGGHSGPAWIGLVSYSKTGKTVYFNGKAFQKIGSERTRGNFYDLETMEEYWIAGVKKDFTERQQSGAGKIVVEERIVEKYLKLIGQETLDRSKFEVASVIEEIPVDSINELENQESENSAINDDKRFNNPTNFSDAELDYFISYYEDDAVNGQHLKNRKVSRKKMNELLTEKDKRETAGSKPENH